MASMRPRGKGNKRAGLEVRAEQETGMCDSQDKTWNSRLGPRSSHLLDGELGLGGADWQRRLAHPFRLRAHEAEQRRRVVGEGVANERVVLGPRKATLGEHARHLRS
eukprot:6112410-Pleurochrysis_carterae.AAC.1